MCPLFGVLSPFRMKAPGTDLTLVKTQGIVYSLKQLQAVATQKIFAFFCRCCKR